MNNSRSCGRNLCPNKSVLLCRFKTDQEAIDMANDTDYGLAAYFFSKDLKRCWTVASELEYGMIGVNDVRSTV